ncbi:reverse transcriptase domain-containing protein [Tanacetum coccineum]
MDAQEHYTTTEKELLAVVYAFEKFWPYLVLSKTIVYTDHSALKYLLAKQDAKTELLRCISYSKNLMSLFMIKKRAENLVADHLSRLENPHQDVLENKEITETFPLKTLGMVTFRGDSSTPWASTSWGHYRLLEGISTFSWSLTTRLNGLKQNRSPLMMPELLIASDYEDSRARGFVLRSLEL